MNGFPSKLYIYIHMWIHIWIKNNVRFNHIKVFCVKHYIIRYMKTGLKWTRFPIFDNAERVVSFLFTRHHYYSRFYYVIFVSIVYRKLIVKVHNVNFTKLPIKNNNNKFVKARARVGKTFFLSYVIFSPSSWLHVPI